FGIGLLDQGTDPAEHLASPVAKLLDSRVDQLGRRFAFLRPALLHHYPVVVNSHATRPVSATSRRQNSQPCATNQGSSACRRGAGGLHLPSCAWLKKIQRVARRFATACKATGRSASGHSWSVLRSITTSYGPGQRAGSQRSPTTKSKRPLRPPDLPPRSPLKRSSGGVPSLATFAAKGEMSSDVTSNPA